MDYRIKLECNNRDHSHRRLNTCGSKRRKAQLAVFINPDARMILKKLKKHKVKYKAKVVKQWRVTDRGWQLTKITYERFLIIKDAA